jgi:hypothetical protein
MARRAALALLAVSLLLEAGCASLRWPFFARPDHLHGAFTEQDLGIELGAYAARFAAQVGTAADDIHQATTVRSIRRRALVWTLQVPPLVDQLAYDPNTRFAFVACLLIATAQRQYLVEGDGRAVFGEQQPIAVDAANVLLEDALAIGTRFLTAAQLDDVRERAEELARKYPIQGRDFAVQRVPRALVRQDATASLGWIFTLPLAPFRALEGVDSGAAAIHEFNRTAQEFAQIASRMPERIRGQLQLFLYDFEDRDTVRESLAAADRVAASAERISEVAAALPAELRKALVESQGNVDAIGRVVEQARGVVGPLDEASRQLEQASAHWLAMIGPRDPNAPPSNERPADERWRDTAQAVGGAAAELRGLADDLRTLTGESDVSRAVDHLFWRAVALLVVFFALLLVYRALAARLAVGDGPRRQARDN